MEKHEEEEETAISRFVELSDALEKDGKVLYMKGRPLRTKIIQSSEITDFVIFLNTCRDWTEFLFNI